MTSPAPITHELTWAEMEAAIFQFTADMIASSPPWLGRELAAYDQRKS